MKRIATALLLGVPAGASAQNSASIGAQAVVSGTRLTNAVEGRTLTEGYVSQPVVMGHAALAGGHVSLVGTLDFEGLTMKRGELLGGVYGEGYVDRRHPHTLVHEAIASLQGTVVGPVRASLAAGKGFVPFGTDDPMTRPFERFPVNHHLAQILERAVVVGGVSVASRAMLEAAAFDGDEPLDPWRWPRLSRFGDSWATRLTIAPLGTLSAATGLQLEGSVAGVRAPENPDGGGLDQRKWSLGARWTSGAPLGNTGSADGTYALVEWARTDWTRGGVRVTLPGYRDATALAEGGVRRRGVELVARAERTDRPEEERLVDPFRSVRPASDVSNLGDTQWSVLTLGAALPRTSRRAYRAAPFVEASMLSPRALVPSSVFDPVSFYGGRHLWAVTAGLRLGAGMTHGRMGRYGVAADGHVGMHDAHVSHPMEMP